MTTESSTSGVTLWRRVADAIEGGIAEGTYTQGQRLPSEADIAEAYKVNRHTVRRALAVLAERGLVRAERGSGTYVEAPRLDYPLCARTRFSEIVGAGGREPLGQLIGAATEAATRSLASALAVKPGAPLIRIESLRLADRAPICIATTWFVKDRFPEADRIYDRVRSTTKLLAHYGVLDYRRETTHVTAALVDPSDAVRLDLTLGRPVLVVTSTDVEPDGRPVLTARSRFAADRVEFVFDTKL